MRLSIIISVYNSHGAVARQVKYWGKMNLPDDVEFILVDDGSAPPLGGYELKNLQVYQTGNRLAWTQGLGRNLGALKAKGEYLLMTDIDHILSGEAIEAARSFKGDRMAFPRDLGVLTEDGDFTQDADVLVDYGWDVSRKRGLYASVHLNTFAIRAETFHLLEGYDPQHSLVGFHPVTKKGDDCYFNTKWNHYAAKRGIRLAMGPPIYMFPIGRYHVRGETNPKGLFHNLSYDGHVRMMKGEERAH